MVNFSPYPPPPPPQLQDHHQQHQQQHLFPPPPPPLQQQQHYYIPNPPNPNPNEALSSSPVGPTPAAASAAVAATLLVRHLPEAIPHDMLSRLFSHYGASSVRPCAGGKLRNCAFVDFKDEALASQAQAQMNRLRFLGKVLSVERFGSDTKNTDSQSDSQSGKDSSGPLQLSLNESSNPVSSVYGGEPIAPRLGVDYPFPPHLEYEYPLPDGNILTNIVNALIAVPRFYTQVLHLMNKMNLPAPFRMALPTPPLPPPVPAPAPPPPPVTVEPPRADLSSDDESELESSEDDAGDNNNRKRIKREAIVGPGIDKAVAHESVGLKPVSLVPKEVPMIKKKNPVLQIKIASKPIQKEITDDSNSTKELTEPLQKPVEQRPYATPEDIEKGKLPPEEILSLPMFKEGRMRGQAFVTFPSIDLAHRALNLVNGYVFKGKPMIIQFGRNPAAGKTT